MQERKYRNPPIVKVYSISNPKEVFRFLQEHPSLPEVVWEAAHVLRYIFGLDTPLELKLLRDPETGEEELFAFVHVDAPVEEALQKLDVFDDEWFLDKQGIVNGRFNVDVVFVCPSTGRATSV